MLRWAVCCPTDGKGGAVQGEAEWSGSWECTVRSAGDGQLQQRCSGPACTDSEGVAVHGGAEWPGSGECVVRSAGDGQQ